MHQQIEFFTMVISEDRLSATPATHRCHVTNNSGRSPGTSPVQRLAQPQSDESPAWQPARQPHARRASGETLREPSQRLLVPCATQLFELPQAKAMARTLRSQRCLESDQALSRILPNTPGADTCRKPGPSRLTKLCCPVLPWLAHRHLVPACATRQLCHSGVSRPKNKLGRNTN